MINTTGDEVDQAPIVVTNQDGLGSFLYSGGNFVISADRQDDPNGTFLSLKAMLLILMRWRHKLQLFMTVI